MTVGRQLARAVHSRLAAGPVIVVIAGIVWGCAPDPRTTGDRREHETTLGGYRVRYHPTPDPIPRNQPFALEIEVVPLRGNGDSLEIRVDGRMPAHQHGMTIRPELERVGPHAFRVAPLLFHMRGQWEITVDVIRGGVTERATFAVALP